MNELYWAAGFLEGEGSFCATHSRKSCAISAVQVQMQPLERLQAFLGAGNITKKSQLRPRFNEQQAYRFELAGNRAAAWMMTLWSVMSPRRREQIEKALVSWRSVRIRATIEAMNECWRGHELTPENTYIGREAEGRPRRRCVKCRDDGAARRRAAVAAKMRAIRERIDARTA